MEDRHYLSEPRPIEGLKLPTWEVDIMREGVDMPILTLQVDNQVLPPRKRKKKVVWKLPDNSETNPKFGMEDKRRILELFKQKKKELKRQRKSQTTTSTSTSTITTSSTSTADGRTESGTVVSSNNNDNQNSPGIANAKTNSKLLNRMSSSALSVDSYITAKEEQPEDDPGEEKVEYGMPEEEEEEEEEKVEDTNLGSSPTPPGFNMTGLSLEKSTTTTTTTTSASPTTPSSSVQHQRHQQHQQVIPPPSFQPIQERSHSFAGISRGPPPMSTSSNTPTSPPPGLNSAPATGPSRRASTSSIPPPGMTSTNPFHQTTTTNMARHFIVANPNALGHVVMETYYMLLRNGMIQELVQYHLPNAQKSLTVGGAHALCTHADQRLMQLESLTKMILQVKGVLQHPRNDEKDETENIYIMITGTSLRPQCLPFCHSLTLKQVGPQAFQIQNDALAFLTTEG